MKQPLILLVHLLTAVARLVGPGGAKALVAENLLIKQQLLVLTRSRRRAPNLRAVLATHSIHLHPVWTIDTYATHW
jgi:putative transposase